jgi:hypothetical protein
LLPYPLSNSTRLSGAQPVDELVEALEEQLAAIGASAGGGGA